MFGENTYEPTVEDYVLQVNKFLPATWFLVEQEFVYPKFSIMTSLENS